MLELEKLAEQIEYYDWRISVLSKALQDIIDIDRQPNVAQWGNGTVGGPCAKIANDALSRRRSDRYGHNT